MSETAAEQASAAGMLAARQRHRGVALELQHLPGLEFLSAKVGPGQLMRVHRPLLLWTLTRHRRMRCSKNCAAIREVSHAPTPLRPLACTQQGACHRPVMTDALAGCSEACLRLSSACPKRHTCSALSCLLAHVSPACLPAGKRAVLSGAHPAVALSGHQGQPAHGGGPEHLSPRSPPAGQAAPRHGCRAAAGASAQSVFSCGSQRLGVLLCPAHLLDAAHARLIGCV